MSDQADIDRFIEQMQFQMLMKFYSDLMGTIKAMRVGGVPENEITEKLYQAAFRAVNTVREFPNTEQLDEEGGDSA